MLHLVHLSIGGTVSSDGLVVSLELSLRSRFYVLCGRVRGRVGPTMWLKLDHY